MKQDPLHTPLMKQYWEIKKQHPDTILFFRLGDFYEMFFQDAEVASKALQITLTSRDKNSHNPVPLCGVPHHAASTYISKLLEQGHKVAVCEQMEDAKLAKGLVRREVVRVITPGLKTDEEGLASKETNALVSLFPGKTQIGVAWLDATSGIFQVTQVSSPSEMEEEVFRLNPKELLLPEGEPHSDVETWLLSFRIMFPGARVERMSKWIYEESDQTLCRRFSVSTVDGFGLSSMETAISASVALVYYVETQNRTALPHLQPPKPYFLGNFLTLAPSTRDHLELFRSKGKPGVEGSLLGVLDENQTSMGSRQLRDWMNFPLRDLDQIHQRLEAVSELVDQGEFREKLRTQLAHVCDLERLIGKIATQRATPKDLVALRETLSLIPELRSLASKTSARLVKEIVHQLHPHSPLLNLLQQSLSDDPPLSLKEGEVIREGFNQSLDELRKIQTESHDWIARLEAEERKRTGISSLRIRHNRVFGYSIEITKSHLSRVPADYERKQTLVGGERFITQALKEQEEKILGAQEKILTLEAELFEELRSALVKEISSLQNLSRAIATLDVLCSFGRVSSQYRYCRPSVTSENSIRIVGGRHPVIERVLREECFVPNDTHLNAQQQVMILTGPNMAGKSTVMRQVALITLLAQMGCFVPAEEAEIGCVDRIFTRVGASDDLVRGQSTFMVEMSEAASILRNATSQSLVLLDEIGRGTSTFDGLSIAWAVAEYLHDQVKSKTIFATHYHELTDLARTKPRIFNMNVSVREWEGRIVFLRTLSPGAVNRSYGIEVARLAGVIPWVISRAKEILQNLEKGEFDALGNPVLARSEKTPQEQAQFELFRRLSEEWLEEFSRVEEDQLTPKQALDLVYQWKQRFSGR